MPGPVEADRAAHLRQLHVRLRLQPRGHPRRRRRLRPRRPPPPALDGLGRHGPQLGLRRLLLAATKAVPKAVENEASSAATNDTNANEQENV